LADTVGFIRHLPHDLVAAFKATLQETQEADLLLHVIDYADDQYLEYTDQVNEVLDEIGAGEVPQLIVCNKIDRLEGVVPKIDRDDTGRPIRVWISAQAGLGIDLLKNALAECLHNTMVRHRLKVPPNEGSLRGMLYNINCIASQSYSDDGYWLVDIKMLESDWNKIDKRLDNRLNNYIL
jgi:GTP-binding protein HflX